MSNYVQSVFFCPKDSLLPGNPAKLIKGCEVDPELAAIAAAIATKLDVANAANPTGTVGLSAVNGVASTYMRSDGAPALSQAIVPTWTGIHTFSATPVFNAGVTRQNAGGSSAVFNQTTANADVQTSYQQQGTVKLYIGVAGATNNGNTGTAPGDTYVRGQNQGILFSGNAGLATAFQITSGNAVQVSDGSAFWSVGYKEMPGNTQGGAYTLVLSDSGKFINASGNITIPAQASVNFPIGTIIGMYNNTGGALTISSTDGIILAGTGSSGTGSVAVNGFATMFKRASSSWLVSGPGVS